MNDLRCCAEAAPAGNSGGTSPRGGGPGGAPGGGAPGGRPRGGGPGGPGGGPRGNPPCIGPPNIWPLGPRGPPNIFGGMCGPPCIGLNPGGGCPIIPGWKPGWFIGWKPMPGAGAPPGNIPCICCCPLSCGGIPCPGAPGCCPGAAMSAAGISLAVEALSPAFASEVRAFFAARSAQASSGMPFTPYISKSTLSRPSFAFGTLVHGHHVFLSCVATDSRIAAVT